MSIEGQGHFFTIYFPGFVCFVLYKAKISGENLQDHWSCGLNFRLITAKFSGFQKFRNFTVVWGQMLLHSVTFDQGLPSLLSEFSISN